MFAKALKAALAASASFVLFSAEAASRAPSAEQWNDARTAAAELADSLASQCPVAEPGDQKAFDVCRRGLFGDTELRAKLNTIVLWGRQKDPALTLEESSLTQFAPDALTGMYLPLFMFNGKHTVSYVEREGMFQIRMATAFRNRLSPGQFPYPFWHEPNKWTMYQSASEILLWWDPMRGRVKVAQFTPHGGQPPIIASPSVEVPPSFDGKWMWTDAQGKTQPKVTLFDGLFRSDNPYLTQIEDSYKVLAMRLRQGQCDSCHVPSNPNHSKRLVLLQTPVHAAAEIERVLKSVSSDRMPRDETGIETPLDAKTKKALLEDGEAFAKLVSAAKRWEATARDTRVANTSH